MTRLRPLLLGTAIGFAVATAPPLTAHAQQAATCDAVLAAKWCFEPNGPMVNVNVHFNAALDPMLETGTGDAATRATCFQKAVDQWNLALAAVNAKVRLVAMIDNAASKWATNQDGIWCIDEVPCPDPQIPGPVAAVYTDDPAYAQDSNNSTSTSRNLNGNNKDCMMVALGPGWDANRLDFVSDPNNSPMDLLGITYPRTGQNNACWGDVDINWYTHFTPTNRQTMPCPRIKWDYRFTEGPQNGANRYDYYSVLLHELGHLLGLDHQADDGTGENVMRAYATVDKRYKIGAKETRCICDLYKVGNIDCGTVTPTESATWGRLKGIYR